MKNTDRECSPCYEIEAIGGKHLYSFACHATALRAWAVIRNELEKAPLLLTLDHHTDCHPAFLRATHVGRDMLGRNPNWESEAESMVRNLNRTNSESVKMATLQLRNDEHIDAAIQSDILSYAYVINLSNGQTKSLEENQYCEQMCLEARLSRQERGLPDPMHPKPPFTYRTPENSIFMCSRMCAVGCQVSPHDEQCERKHANQVIESVYLDEHLHDFACMSRSAGVSRLQDAPFILDIDLDYFHTLQSVRPVDPRTFHELIRRSIAVTVALEPQCVEDLRLTDETIDSLSLLEDIRRHVAEACRGTKPVG